MWFWGSCTKKYTLISFKTYDMIQRPRLANVRNKYYLSLYLICQIMITIMKVKGFRNGTRAFIYLQRCCWRCRSSGMWRRVVGRAFHDILKECNAFIFQHLGDYSFNDTSTKFRRSMSSVAYPGILFEGGSRNSVEDTGQRRSGGDSPLVRGSGGSCNLVQEISFHIVKLY